MHVGGSSYSHFPWSTPLLITWVPVAEPARYVLHRHHNESYLGLSAHRGELRPLYRCRSLVRSQRLPQNRIRPAHLLPERLARKTSYSIPVDLYTLIRCGQPRV